MPDPGSEEWGMQSYDGESNMPFRTIVNDTFSLAPLVRVQHPFLLQVREANHEGVHPVPCEVCCERALQTMYPLSQSEMQCDPVLKLEALRVSCRFVGFVIHVHVAGAYVVRMTCK